MSPQKVFDASLPQSIQRAVEVLRQGGIIAFPTETVYGLGADAMNDKAVCRIFEAKKRPEFDPLIVHVASVQEAETLWSQTPESATLLMKRFWPGPLTLVLPKSSRVSDLVTSGLPTVAVRMPKHEAAFSLIKALGRPIAAPSANLFGYTSPTSASHVAEDLGEAVDLILDGGPCAVGVESTVLKIEKNEGTILRPGGIPAEALEKVIPLKKAPDEKTARPESPGLLDTHYAPWTRMVLLPGAFSDFIPEFDAALKEYQARKSTPLRVGLLSFRQSFENPALETVQVLSAKGDLYEAAANLFQAIRKLDKMNLDLILAEPVPEKGIGLAILDRLRRAAGGKIAGKEPLC